MADSVRSRSRSPDHMGGGPPPQDAPPPAAPAGDGGGEEIKLYIGNLSYTTDESKLRSEFERHGAVTDVFLPTDRDSGRPRGFGFVTYATRADAEEAIRKMDQTEMDGRTIRVNESRPRGEGGGGGGGGGFNSSGASEVKLYVGGLSYDTNEDGLRGLFEMHGSVTDCFIPTDRETGRPRGFAFVTMSAADAEKAQSACDGYELDGRVIRVNESRPRGGGGRGGGGGGYGG
eukprot:CAMPEP_0183291110 /NCGR_PEP_ID=MMETSP0160_2-20130417/644_1 /TAXON_ID=2839 ORGANISM="Odontella Sinensis, Strain Grunow 1884" /NCGR_SAMPLE_ID=MMETSP0160_2 /ASSEMBLY_ACC=CAM_ASM_000250 /LENGTH=230 /DNA_ID=CAMNT_0025451865 /DNA_START=52 /DNA_END=740 /DNA_ORIENTATION=+